MTWQSGSINPTTTSPAADITKITNDLAVLRSVLGGGADTDVPITALRPDGSGNVSTSSGGFSVAYGTTVDPYGAVSANRPNVASSFSYYAMVRSGAQPWALGIDTSNRFIIGIPSGGYGGTIASPNFYIDTVGAFGFGSTPSAGYRLTIGGDARVINSGWTMGGSYTPQSGDAGIGRETGGGVFVATNGTERLRVGGGGEIYFPGVGTTASAANAFLNSGSSPSNQLLRSTSSIRYKTDVRDLPSSYSEALMQLRPVVYKSNADADDKSLDWVGLIAEEVAAVAPRLVQYTAREGSDELVPDGVQYDRLAVVMLQVIKQMKADNDNLKMRVTALEAAA